MSDSIRWDDSYSVGVEEFDEDHRRLIELGRAVIEASTDGQVHGAVRELLDALQVESTEHFAREEEMMRATGYPLLQDHLEKHNRLTAELHLFMQQYEMGHIGAQWLADSLVHWVVSHIVQEDKRFQQHRMGVGMGAADRGARTGAPTAATGKPR